MLEALRPIVGDVSKFSLHSLRAGGASEAAKAGVSDRLFKRHGRWKTDTAKDTCVQESFSNLLIIGIKIYWNLKKKKKITNPEV